MTASKPKYRICSYTNGPSTDWQVIRVGSEEIISRHRSSDDAHAAAQRYVAEDRDFAMEGR